METKQNELSITKSSTKNQYIAAAVCTMICINCGIMFGWGAYTNPVLLSRDNAIFTEPISHHYASLISSLPDLGSILGTPFFGWLFDKVGRKRGGLMIAIPLTISWILILLAPTPEFIVVARFLGGFSGGASVNFTPLYTSETADVSIRGALGSLLAVGIVFGVLLSYIIGALTGYYTTVMIALSGVLMYAILMTMMPETPIYLVKNGKKEEAAKSIAWLKSVSIDSSIVKDEIVYLSRLAHILEPEIDTRIYDDITDSKCKKDELKSLKDESVFSKSDLAPRIKRSAWRHLMFDRASRRAFLLALVLLTFQDFVGVYAIQNYSTVIFAAAKTNIPSYICSIIYAACLVVGSGISSALVDRVGRKFLLVLSGSSLTLVLVLCGITFQTGFGPAILPAIFVCLCGFTFYLGVGPVPYIILGEYFCTEVKDLAASILVVHNCFFSFVVIYSFQAGIDVIGFTGMFYMFGAISFANVIVALVFLPETKGLNQEEILKIFENGGQSDGSITHDAVPLDETKA